mgnify:CR=1 FL=1
MKWPGVTLALLLMGFFLFPVLSANSSDSPVREATFVVG